MNILVACEESQRVCLAFREKGHNAFSCDLQDCTGGFPQFHIKGDVLPLLNGNCIFYTSDGCKHFITGNWDMLIGFPPCTYFSRCNFFNYYRNGVFNYKRFEESKKYVDFFFSLYNANIPLICLENPLPISLFTDILPPYSMRLQPFEFGEPYSKLTCLWLKGLPPLLPTLLCTEYSSYVKFNQRIDGVHSIAEQSKYRSKTFNGVAKAMADQWG